MCRSTSALQTKQELKGYEYQGDKLRAHMDKILSDPTVKEKLEEKATTKPQAEKPIMFTKTKQEPIVVPKTKEKPKPKVRVGYKKINLAISERLARAILNYAGHSSKKAATIPVFVKGDVAEVDDDPDTVLPVYPLSVLENK